MLFQERMVARLPPDCSSCFLSRNPSTSTGGRFSMVFRFLVCLLKLCVRLRVVKDGVLLCFLGSTRMLSPLLGGLRLHPVFRLKYVACEDYSLVTWRSLRHPPHLWGKHCRWGPPWSRWSGQGGGLSHASGKLVHYLSCSHLLKVFPVELDLLRPPPLVLSPPLIGDPGELLLLDALEPLLLPPHHLLLLGRLLSLPQGSKVLFNHCDPVNGS